VNNFFIPFKRHIDNFNVPFLLKQLIPKNLFYAEICHQKNALFFLLFIYSTISYSQLEKAPAYPLMNHALISASGRLPMS